MQSLPTEFALAVDVGGTKAESALIDRSGVVLPGSRHRVETGPETGRESLEYSVTSIVRKTRQLLPADGHLVGVGVGSAGPLDLMHRTVSPVNLPGAALASFDSLEEVAGAPVSLGLDGTCIALAEHRFGAARGHETVLALVVSTGVGGGLVVANRPVTGRSGNAGHIGQMWIESRNATDLAVAGTVEGMAAGPRVVEWAREQGWDGQNGHDLSRDYANGVAIAVAAVRRSANAVGTAIASVSMLLDLEVAVVAGGFAEVSHDYLDLVATATREQTLLPYAANVIVKGTGLAGTGPLVGASVLAFDEHDLGTSCG